MATSPGRGVAVRAQRAALGRMRSQLNQEVRRRVSRAVDVVWDAFEDELEAAQPRVVGVDNYELFHDCCTRLAQFIESNMDTTPGFLEQMERLILACHSGATGAALRQVMTKDLRIRRPQSEDKQMQIKVEQPEISPPNSTIHGEESRKWGTRKRLSTKSKSKSKRVKCSLSFWRNVESDDEEKEHESGEDDFKGKPQSFGEHDVLQEEPLVRARRRNCVRQLEPSFEQEEEQSAGTMGDGGEVVEAASEKHDKSMAWNLRQTPQRLRMSTDKEKKQEKIPISECIKQKNEGETKEDPGLPEENGVISVGQVHGDGEEKEFSATAQELQGVDSRVFRSDNESKNDEGAAKHVREILGALCEQVCLAVESILAEPGQPNEAEEENRQGKVDQLDHEMSAAQVKNEERLQPEAGVNASASVDDSDAGMTSQTAQEIDEEQIEREMRHLVRSLELAPDSLDIGAARTRYQELLNSLNDLDNNVAVPPEPIDLQDDKDEEVREDNSIDSDNERPVPGLCDARTRGASQASRFKSCLRKSIAFVDAVLCNPPPGKVCARNCEQIRARQCSDGVSCLDAICRNWHRTEAHTERCKNPLCEFRNRILLREIKHQIANKEPQVEAQQAQWKVKNIALLAAANDEADGNISLEQVTQMSEELRLLEHQLEHRKEELDSLKDTRRVLLTNLSAIGVTPQDDAKDHFPDFESHYISAEDDTLE